MHAGLDRRSRHAVALRLVGARGVDENVGRNRGKLAPPSAARHRAGPGVTLARAVFASRAACASAACQRASRQDEFDVPLARQPLGGARPEGAIAAEHEDTTHRRCGRARYLPDTLSRNASTWRWKAGGSSAHSMCDTPGMTISSEPLISRWIASAAAGGVA